MNTYKHSNLHKVKIIFFDIDGVLTDGMVHVDESGHEYKSYRLTEIDAINDIINAGYRTVAVTGEDTPIVDVFERRVAWSDFVRGCKDKLSEVKRISYKYNCNPQEICYIGDGKYDISPIEYAGVGVCPQNAIQCVKEVADIVLNGYGGNNCIYELYEILKYYKCHEHI